jgi:chemotaxis-related protein WspB
MLFLKFRIGDEVYALETQQIIEITPLLPLTRMPQAPAGIAGLIDYRGRPVPVVDLSELVLGRPARAHISTRLILVRYAVEHELGLIAEHATDMMRREPCDFSNAGIISETAPYLGAVTRDEGSMIQRIEIEKLLPSVLSTALFRRSEEDAWSTTALPPS